MTMMYMVIRVSHVAFSHAACARAAGVGTRYGNRGAKTGARAADPTNALAGCADVNKTVMFR